MAISGQSCFFIVSGFVLVLEFYGFLAWFGLVVESVEGGDDVFIFFLSLVVGEFEVVFGGDGYYFGGVAYVCFFAFFEAVDYIVDGFVHFFFCSGGCPEEYVSVFCPDGFELAGAAGGFVVDEFHDGGDGGMAVVSFVEEVEIVAGVVFNGFGIPQAAAFYIGGGALYFEFGVHLVEVGVGLVGVFYGAHDVLAYVEGTVVEVF